MLRQETITINGRTLVKTYSDAGKYIIQLETRNKYTEAIDIPGKYHYTESNEDIPVEPQDDIVVEKVEENQ